MGIRPCDLTNEQYAALRREAEQKVAQAPAEKKEPEATPKGAGCWRNGRWIAFENAPSNTSKWEQMGEAARKERNKAFTNDQIRNRGTE